MVSKLKIAFLLTIVLTFFKVNYFVAQSFSIVGNNIGFTKTSTQTIKSVFKGKYSLWSNKESVTLVLPSTKSSNAGAVAKYLYGTTVNGMQKYWLSMVFQGRANPPIFLETDDEIITYVSKNSGAIGIVSSTNKNIPTTIKITISD